MNKMLAGSCAFLLWELQTAIDFLFHNIFNVPTLRKNIGPEDCISYLLAVILRLTVAVKPYLPSIWGFYSWRFTVHVASDQYFGVPIQTELKIMLDDNCQVWFMQITDRRENMNTRKTNQPITRWLYESWAISLEIGTLCCIDKMKSCYAWQIVTNFMMFSKSVDILERAREYSTSMRWILWPKSKYHHRKFLQCIFIPFKWWFEEMMPI